MQRSFVEINQPGEGRSSPLNQKTMISDSEVLNAIAILKAYAEQVKEERGSLYWDAMKSGNEEFAKAHLKRFQAATYIEQQCPTIMQWYRDSK